MLKNSKAFTISIKSEGFVNSQMCKKISKKGLILMKRNIPRRTTNVTKKMIWVFNSRRLNFRIKQKKLKLRFIKRMCQSDRNKFEKKNLYLICHRKSMKDIYHDQPVWVFISILDDIPETLKKTLIGERFCKYDCV